MHRGFLIALGLCCLGVAVFVILFLRGLALDTKDRDARWAYIEKVVSNKYQFKFFGDCSAPNSIEQRIKYHLSTCAAVGFLYQGVECDVYDITIYDKDTGSVDERQHTSGIILQTLREYVKPEYVKNFGELTPTSKDGEYMTLLSPNQKYIYIIFINDAYHPVTVETVDWYGERELAELLNRNLTIIADAVDKFCIYPDKVGEK